MSITGDSPVAYRRFSGYADPRYPEGQWVGSITLSGDASGGTSTLSLVFSEATVAVLNSRMFSLEEFGVSVSAGANDDGRLSTDNLGLGGQAAFQHRFSMSIDTPGGVATVQLRTDSQNILPLFLGGQRVISVQTRILWQQGNPGAGVDTRFEAAGYWWGSRSVMIDGGPQRPPTGLYQR